MSRSNKAHTHKSPSVRHNDSSARSRDKAIRSFTKSRLKNIIDSNEIELDRSNRRTRKIRKAGSAGYINPLQDEFDILKEFLSYRQSVTKDLMIYVPNALKKDIIYKAKLKSAIINSFDDAITILNENELKECIHKFYASKGLNKFRK